MFHTRQQHTLKVAQVGRRLAQICNVQQPKESNYWGVDPDVVEAACLAHDLGHPPFGHVGEHTLNDLVETCSSGSGPDLEGFEGNAQSFRVVTKLSVRFSDCDGLDLTRAILSAILKYPWIRDRSRVDRIKKWGAYQVDLEDFLFTHDSRMDGVKSAEAELMDWADDIAYSVHDLEDFHRCGAIPWKRILDGGEDADQLIDRATKAWFGAPVDARSWLKDALRDFTRFMRGSFGAIVEEPYEGTRSQRYQLRLMTSQLIGLYIKSVVLNTKREFGNTNRTIKISPESETQVRVLKKITRDYIINNPSLVAQQKGQARIIENLFGILAADSVKGPPKFLPTRLRYLWSKDITVARFAADCIASLTEAEAIGLHARLLGLSSGSVLDPIVR